jgi:hypothetical protein
MSTPNISIMATSKKDSVCVADTDINNNQKLSEALQNARMDNDTARRLSQQTKNSSRILLNISKSKLNSVHENSHSIQELINGQLKSGAINPEVNNMIQQGFSEKQIANIVMQPKRLELNGSVISNMLGQSIGESPWGSGINFQQTQFTDWQNHFKQ